MAACRCRTLGVFGIRSSALKLIFQNLSAASTQKITRFATEAQVDLQADISISESCIKRMKKICEPDQFLRVLVEGGGCSGFQYKFELDTDIDEDDRVFHKAGCRIVVDEESLKFLEGSTIDYHTELIKAGFRVEKNPNAEKGCSCGTSFSVKI